MRAPSRELFRDAAFPASDSSLFSSFSTPLAQFRGDITWRRPQEICASPQLFADSPREGQVKQGLLGDCWFLCACAALSRSRRLLHQVFPAGQPCWREPAYRGAFTCRVWRFGQWVEVTVDDRLPCLAGRLCFSRCHKEDVFWLPLLEKVYAKCVPGRPAAGGLPRVGRRGPGTWGSFMPSLSRVCKNSRTRRARASCCCGFTTPGAAGVGRGLGERESGHLQSLCSGQELCHTQQLQGAWVRGQSAGGCRNNRGFPSNPKFWLRVSEPSEVYASVLQQPGLRVAADSAGTASSLGSSHQAVGLHIWKVEKRRVSLPRVLSAPPVAGTVCHAYDREVHLRCELSPGHYLAVPSTFLKDVPGRFLLRVFSTGRVALSALRPAPASPTAGEWETVRLHGCWQSGRSAGGSRNFASYPSNPSFPLLVPAGAPRCVRISLRQHCRTTQCHPIGFHVFQVPEDGDAPGQPPLLLREPVLSCVPHSHAPEVSQLCQLAPGAYRVVPSTYLPDTEGTFTLLLATRIDRRSIHSRELLGQPLQETLREDAASHHLLSLHTAWSTAGAAMGALLGELLGVLLGALLVASLGVLLDNSQK
ncbi:calpain-10 isoform X4 [Sorex araneus]|uniref:calpain-10 isoform X4 n=1 Tax=Sorex araneus TaxID=42254 RepID=UPI0024335280|nr:calpain-10 isoform X4 [Sorex araneus]